MQDFNKMILILYAIMDLRCLIHDFNKLLV